MQKFNNYSLSIVRIIFYLIIIFVAIDTNSLFLTFILLASFIILEYTLFYQSMEKKYGKEMAEMQNKMNSIHEMENKTRSEMALIFNTILLPIVYIDTNRKFSYMNESFSHLFEGHLKTSIRDFSGIEILQEIVTDAYLNEEPYSKEIVYEGVYYHIIFDPLFIDSYFEGMVMIFNDISHYKQTEQLHKNFIQNVSHELKTPIAAIKGASEILLADKKVDEVVYKEFLEIIHSENERLEAMVLDLIDITRIESDSFTLSRTEVDPVSVCEKITRSFKLQKDRKGIDLIFKHIGLNDKLYALDPKRLQQVLLNLIANAIHYTDHGQVVVTCDTQENQVVFTIRDTGIGISEANQIHIFDRFFRVDKARSRNSGGTGLGLSIVKSIVSAHGGSIELTSKENDFTQFVVVFPNIN